MKGYIYCTSDKKQGFVVKSYKDKELSSTTSQNRKGKAHTILISINPIHRILLHQKYGGTLKHLFSHNRSLCLKHINYLAVV